MLSERELGAYLSQLREYISENATSMNFQLLVDAPFRNKLCSVQLDLGIVVLLLVNEKSKTIDRISLSQTELAQGAVNVSAKPFHEIKIPLDYTENIIAKAIQSKQMQQTDDWQYLFIPDLTPEEARFNQAGAGIGTSLVTPFYSDDKKGALIFSLFQPLEGIQNTHYDFSKHYCQIVEDALRKRKTTSN